MSNIDKAYADMFNPYSEVWEVSGTSAPTWTWMVSKGADGGVVVGDTYTTMDTKSEKGKVVSKDFYDIRTDRLYAPFSIFARHMLMDYMGMLGVMRVCDENVLAKNFDTGLARGGVMWSNAEPTYKNIIDAFENINAGRYKIQDFIYNKYYKHIPPNYLITLRRYGMPCTDIPFVLAYPEDVHADMDVRSAILPIATATTYMSEFAGNKMEDILKFTWGTNWKEQSSEIQTITSGTPGASSFGIGAKWHNDSQDGSAVAAGMGATFFSMLSGHNYSPQQMSIAAQAAQINPWDKYSKYTQGPVDTVMKTNIRDIGLNFEQNFSLKFEYELKSLQYVNPKIAMLDIIGNMILMGTNTGTWWGGATRYYGNGGGYGKQPGDLAAFARGDYAAYGKSLVDHVMGQIESWNGGDFPQSLEEWANLAKNVIKGGLQNIIGGLVNGKLGKLGVTQPANALLSGEPTGMWHVTIGNPLNPIAMMGNMVCNQIEMQMGEGLGYDDFPVNVAFTCQLKHGKPRDAGDIESMFNAGRGRYFHTPYLGNLDKGNPNTAELEQYYKQIADGRKNIPMHVKGGVKDPNETDSSTPSKPKGSYRDRNENGKKAKIKLNGQIDKIMALIR